MEGIDAVERGEDPRGVIRDPARDVIVDCTREVVDDLMAVKA
jgi:hypothetical protein